MNLVTDEEYIKRMSDDIREIKTMLNGNGKMGLFSKVEVMWKCGIFVIGAVSVQTLLLIFNFLGK